MVPNKRYVRNEDMSPDGKLTVIMQEDGDLIVAIDSYDAMGFRSSASAEFCTHGGGGYSKHTREALIKLAEAIEKDNKEKPIVK